MSDLTFSLSGGCFNCRVAAVIVRDGKILAMQDDRSPYWYLPGGRVRLGETAQQALGRELEEELGAAGAVGDGPDQGAELLGVPPGGVLGDPPQGGLVSALGQHTGQGLGLLGLGHRLQRLLVAEEPLDIQRIVG